MSAIPRRRPRASGLYAIVDVDFLSGRELKPAVEEIASVGIEWIQVRAKSWPDARLYASLEGTLELWRERFPGTTVWINDRPDLAALLEASAIHLGQDDLPPSVARQLLGPDVWIGRSTHDEAQVARADADPAVDVIAIGPVFATSSKERPDPVVGLEGVRRARTLTAKPLVAIGGLDAVRGRAALVAGADSVAMIGALMRAPDLTVRARELMTALQS